MPQSTNCCDPFSTGWGPRMFSLVVYITCYQKMEKSDYAIFNYFLSWEYNRDHTSDSIYPLITQNTFLTTYHSSPINSPPPYLSSHLIPYNITLTKSEVASNALGILLTIISPMDRVHSVERARSYS